MGVMDGSRALTRWQVQQQQLVALVQRSGRLEQSGSGVAVLHVVGLAARQVEEARASLSCAGVAARVRIVPASSLGQSWGAQGRGRV
jgi:hypothetical protein